MDCIPGTDIIAVHTIETLRVFPALLQIGGCVPLTCVRTSPAVIAVFANRPSQEGIPRKNAKETSQRAKVLAPEASLHKVQSQNEKKQEPYNRALQVKWLLEREKNLFQDGVGKFGGIYKKRYVCIIEG